MFIIAYTIVQYVHKATLFVHVAHMFVTFASNDREHGKFFLIFLINHFLYTIILIFIRAFRQVKRTKYRSVP